jgi:hypothetical protein
VVSLATLALCISLLWLTWLLAGNCVCADRPKELAQLATTDGLTGVANRRMLDQTLRHEWFRAQRSGEPLSVMMIDADHFKAFNDRYGHQAGIGHCASWPRSSFRTCGARRIWWRVMVAKSSR